MAKKVKTYDVTFIYDVFYETDKPISASMLGKIRKNVDLLDIYGENHIKITMHGVKLTTPENPIDEIQPFANKFEADMAALLRSCSKAFMIRKTQVFVM